MSDSESDLLPSNVFTFQNENTMISAKGPSVNSANMTNLSFRNNVLTSTMHMPRNFERQRFGEPSFDQRSMYYRRATSPASMYSGSARNFHRSYYDGGVSSQRSMYYGRSGSPMSMRSMDSNASVSAADIALAFKNVNFNKHDLRMIKDAYNKFMKRRIRKKIEKRRNMRLFLKGYQRKSGYDSGDQGSDSSISSDDCKSTSSAMYKDNMSCRSTRTDIGDFRRSIRESNMYKDCTDSFRQNAFKNMFSMHSANATHATQNVPPIPEHAFAVPNTVNKPAFTQKDRFRNSYLLPSQRFNKSVVSVPIFERDPRLQARQNTWNSQTPQQNEIPKVNGHVNDETESDQEEIFSEVTIREKTMQNYESQYDKITDQGKRGLEIIDSNCCSDRKRPKLSSPLKESNKANDLLKEKNTNLGTKNNKAGNDKKNKNNGPNNLCKNNQNKSIECPENKHTNEFEFLKPQFPVRKSGPAKTKEKLISKSAQPLIDDIIPLSKPSTVKNSETVVETASKTTVTEVILAESQQSKTDEQQDVTQQSNSNTSDLSMRPSFIKRKLFTQKTDVTESKNLSNGAINVNSPQTNVYSAIQKEKHKARKLVTNQSCLSRDIAQEGNNLLDLIHKIVPPDRINMTNVTNKTSISNSVSNNNPVHDDDKWDVTSIISTCNNENVSDTYTDEEIFAVDETKKKMEKTVNEDVQNNDVENKIKENDKKHNNVHKPNNNKRNIKNISTSSMECRILVQQLPQNILPPKATVEMTKKAQENDYNKKSVYNCVKSFWDTDFESDMESPAPKRVSVRSESVKENQNKSNTIEECRIPKTKKPFNVSLASVSESIKSKTMPTNNIGKLRKFNISKTLTIKSYLTPVQIKSKSIKENILESDNTPKQSNLEPLKKTATENTTTRSAKKSVGTKKTVVKKTTTKNNGDLLDTPHTQPKKTEVKKSNRKHNGDILDTISTTTKPKKPEVKKPNGDLLNSSMSTKKPKKTSKKNNGDLLDTSRTKAQPKKMEVKKTNRKNNGDLLDISKTKAQPKNTKKNGNVLDAIKTTNTRAAKAQSNKAIANKSISETRTLRTPKRKLCCGELETTLNRSTRSSATKSKKTEEVKKSPKQNTNSANKDKGNKKTVAKNTNRKRNSDILDTSCKTQPQTKIAKTQNSKLNTRTTANKSISQPRTLRTPKRKCCDEPKIDLNRTTRSASKSSGARQKNNVSFSKFR